MPFQPGQKPSSSNQTPPAVQTPSQNGGYNSWWGRHTLGSGRMDFWQIGPLSLWAQHFPHQWHIRWKPSPNWLEPVIRMVTGAVDQPIPSDALQVICMFNESREELLFSPALPDRALVTHLKNPILILPSEEVSLYVVSPLWVKIEMTEPSQLLAEVPTFRMSDTWFGPMSRAGDLCYASPGEVYLQIREVPLRLHCAITAVNIKNSGRKALPVERLTIPLPRLSLFYSSRTGFWTDTITFETKGDDAEMAAMKLHNQPPADISPTQFVSGPRQATAEHNSVIRAFSALLRDRSPL